ncbi:hypothetical protein RF11_02888 [Thelohanellus kitauei]|uniref:Reverse transcriptase domain-containing protein n=1 Tax=Thelohanellus kitauei TaxID=669202 RepID=A0A0C2N7F8_THEKT|nr:hypothetical protein RF11_02888 [Thelohanellus kitauei]
MTCSLKTYKEQLKIYYKSGIPQGDPISPLLFNLGIITVHNTLKRIFKLNPIKSILTFTNHLAYMDDIRIYTYRYSNADFKTFELVSNAVGLNLTYEKCGNIDHSMRRDTLSLKSI